MPIDEILAEADDFKLCDGVFSAITGHHGRDIDAAALPEPERVVLLVWHTSGIIDNGGFRYLFEGNLDGDPDFALSAASYAAIGATQAAEAFRQTLATFPGSRPPRDVKKRLRFYLENSPRWPTDQDNQFFSAGDEIRACLAAYVRAHASDFRHLDAPASADDDDEEEEDEPPEDEPADEPAADDGPTPYQVIELLPHWKRVALAARCARQAFPLLTRFWPDVDGKYPRYVLEAIRLAETSAVKGAAADGLERAAVNAIMTAGAALASLPDDDDPKPRNALEGTIASQAAKAAEKAAEAAGADEEKSAFAALEAWNFARSAAEEAEDEELVQRLDQVLVEALESAAGDTPEEEPPQVQRGRRLFLIVSIPAAVADAGGLLYQIFGAQELQWRLIFWPALFLVLYGLLWRGDTWSRWILGIRGLLAGGVVLALSKYIADRLNTPAFLVVLLIAVIHLIGGAVILFSPSAKAFFRYQRERYE